MCWNLNRQYHTRRQIVNTFERIPKGWEQYYSLPDFQKDGVESRSILPKNNIMRWNFRKFELGTKSTDSGGWLLT